MAQRQGSTRKQKKSDFPIFEYIDMLMPQKLVARFVEMPRHVRWTIISAVASLIVLWIFMRVVVGSLNYYIDTRGEFLNDSYYLPYNLSERPLPVSPEGASQEDQFLVLPATIAGQYVLQIPPSEEELQAQHKAEVESFLALSLPAEYSLTTLRQSLAEQLGETSAATDTEATIDESAAAPATDAEAAIDESAAAPATDGDVAAATADAEAVPTAVPTAEPTVNPVQLQAMALDGVLMPLVALNESLADADSLDLVQGPAAELQDRLSLLASSGITMPAEVEAFKQRINELAAASPPVYFRNNECLMAAQAGQGEIDETITPPCYITQRATFVEQADYANNDGVRFNIAVAEFPRPVDAAWAVKQLFYRSRAYGYPGNFALNNIIEYNYFFGRIENVYSLTWSHENWVYSVSGLSNDDVDRMMNIFPY